MRSVTQNVIMMKLKQQLMKDTRLTAVLLLALLGGTSGYAQDDEDPRKAFEKERRATISGTVAGLVLVKGSTPSRSPLKGRLSLVADDG